MQYPITQTRQTTAYPVRLLLFMALLAVIVSLLPLPAALAADDVLDTSFGSGFGPNGNGSVRLGGASYQSLAVDAQGRIIIGGTSDENFVVARYLPDGRRDEGFGVRGERTIRIAPGAFLSAVAVLPDGGIAAGGHGYHRPEREDGRDFYVARLNSSGTPNSAYDWVDRLNFTSAGVGENQSWDEAGDLVVQPDGKIILTGAADLCEVFSCGHRGFAAIRYHNFGVPDNSYDNNGQVLTRFGAALLRYSYAEAGTAALLRDGSLVIAGMRWNDKDGFAAAVIDTYGQPDDNFDGDGLIALNEYGKAVGVAELANGNLVFALDSRRLMVLDRSGTQVMINNRVWTNINIAPTQLLLQRLRINGIEREYFLLAGEHNGQPALERYDPDFNLDRSFGTNGIATVPNFGPISDMAFAADGKILILSGNQLAQLNPAGSLDSGAGFVTTSVGAGNDSLNGLAIAPDGAVYAVGSADTVTSSGTTFRRMYTARYTRDGTLDSNFDRDGILLDASLRPTFGAAVAIAGDRVFSAGSICTTANPCGGYDLMVRSSLTTNGNSISRSIDLSPGDDFAYTLEASAGRLLLGGRAGNQLALLQLDPQTLEPDMSFSGDGRVILDLGAGSFARADALARLPDGKILVAGSYAPPNSVDSAILLARFTERGELDRSFDGDGWLTVDYGPGEDYARSMLVQPDGRIVIGGVITPGGRDALALLRFDAQGVRDSSFGTNGAARADFGGLLFGGRAALLNDGTFILVGYGIDGARREGLVAQFDRNGRLNQAFAGDGLARISFGSSEDVTLALASDGDFAYIGGFAVYQAGNSTSVLARLRVGAGNNQAPVASDDLYATQAGATLQVPAPGVLGNDEDANGDSLSAVLIAPPTNGTLTLATNGSFNYTPAAGFSGIDSFTYRAGDGLRESETAVVRIRVERAGGNAVPVAQPDRFNALQDTQLLVAAAGVLGNDADGDGDALSATLAAPPANGTVNLNASGRFTYTPRPGFSGTDRFSYHAVDLFDRSTPVEVVIEVAASGTDAAPNAVADRYSSGPDGRLELPSPGVVGNDGDPNGDLLSAELVSPPVNGTLELGSDGTLRYQAAPGFSGSDSFSYRVSANGLASEPVTVTIDVPSSTGATPLYQVYLPLVVR